MCQSASCGYDFGHKRSAGSSERHGPPFMNVHREARPAPPPPRALDDDLKSGSYRNQPLARVI